MNAILTPASPHGTLRAIASKSAAHRLLIAAAFADRPTRIRCEQINEDIAATVDCLSALGATITRDAPYYTVTPIANIPAEATLPCRESGSTLRFMLPIAAALLILSDLRMLLFLLKRGLRQAARGQRFVPLYPARERPVSLDLSIPLA